MGGEFTTVWSQRNRQCHRQPEPDPQHNAERRTCLCGRHEAPAGPLVWSILLGPVVCGIGTHVIRSCSGGGERWGMWIGKGFKGTPYHPLWIICYPACSPERFHTNNIGGKRHGYVFFCISEDQPRSLKSLDSSKSLSSSKTGP